MKRHYVVRPNRAPAVAEPADGDWRSRAACADEDPDLFFPVGNSGPALLQTEQARAVCTRCPVMETCRKWALDTDQEFGVWGGLSEDDRRSLKHTARSRAHATV